MDAELNNFYNKWLAKADAHSENILSNHFDKFVSLYVIFNSLYMNVMTALVRDGHSLPVSFKDKIAATDYVIQYVGSNNILTRLLSDEQSNIDFERICQIIDEEHFHIVLEWGVQQRQKDVRLVASLKSKNPATKAKALLELFYYIRCNMFHGHKGYEEHQSDLLIPVNRLLRQLVVTTYNKLNA